MEYFTLLCFVLVMLYITKRVFTVVDFSTVSMFQILGALAIIIPLYVLMLYGLALTCPQLRAIF